MHRDPTRDMDSNGRDLVSIHVHSRFALDAFSMNVKLGKTVNNGLLQLKMIFQSNSQYKAQISMQVLNIIIQIENRVGDQLPRSMMCYLHIETNLH